MNIRVASNSEIKVNAVKKVFGSGYNVTGAKSISGIPEQPYGAGQTIQGAFNRAESVDKFINDSETMVDLIISIENGIVAFGAQFMDIAVIVGYEPFSGRKLSVTSAGVSIEETKLVHEAVFERKQEVTVGQLMAERYGTNSKDPHSYLTNGISREHILIQALEILKSTINLEIRSNLV